MVILITGSSGGIGRAAVELFVKRGHDVHGIDIAEYGDRDGTHIPSPGDISGIVNESDIAAGTYRHHIADVTKPEELSGAFEAGFAPEILVNCAGVQDSGKDIEVNLKGLINVTEMFALKNDRIRAVVNIGSASAHTGAEFPEYAASKGGVIAYTRNAALRLAPRATCNSIDPGGVTTDLNRCVMEDIDLWERIMELTPMRKWASPEEIAEWIYFVAAVNKSMTGQNLLIDNGEAGRSEFIWPE